MGCCGKFKRALQRAAAPPLAAAAPVAAPDPMPRSVSPSIPAPPRAVRADGGGYTVVRDGGATCPTCGARAVVKNVYSERLRRYFEVPWCSTCKAEVA